MTTQPPTRELALVSLSRSRYEQLSAAGFRFSQVAPAFEDPDTPAQVESPATLARSLAAHKALSRYEMTGSGLVLLSGDTIVMSASGRLIGKPADKAEARSMLIELIAAEHEVVTGIAVANHDCIVLDHAAATIAIEPVGALALEEHLDSDLWKGFAGGYRLDDLRSNGWRVRTTLDPVGGLPMELVQQHLASMGVYPVEDESSDSTIREEGGSSI